MNKRQLFLNSLLLAAILMLSSAMQGNAQQNDATGKDQLITVMNPAITEKLVARVPLAPRVDTLKGKTIYLVDMNYEGIGGTPVMEEMRSWFAANMPDVKAVLKIKNGSYVSDDPALWKEIAEAKAGGVILGVAG
jgi:hypothetical protein